MKEKSISNLLNYSCIYIVLLAVILSVSFPYIWLFINSITPFEEMFQIPLQYIPKNASFKNYIYLFQKTSFLLSIKNSLFIAVVSSVFTGVISFMGGYAFARYSFKGRNKLLTSLLLIYLFPEVLLMIPLFTIMKNMGLLNSCWAVIIAVSTNSVPFAIWLLTGFIKGVPIELEEAGRIDGCSLPQLLLRIVLPIMKPGLIGAVSFIFINAWNEYIYAVMFTNEQSRTITVLLTTFVTSYNIRWDLMASGGCLAIIPVLLCFIFMQKHLVAGLTAGAVKG